MSTTAAERGTLNLANQFTPPYTKVAITTEASTTSTMPRTYHKAYAPAIIPSATRMLRGSILIRLGELSIRFYRTTLLLNRKVRNEISVQVL